MLALISPAKSLNFERALPKNVAATLPREQSSAFDLAKIMRRYQPAGIAGLMDISPALAQLNADRYAAFDAAPDTALAKPAALAFDGDVYDGLDAQSFTAAQWKTAQAQLRSLSGLYGVLRPLDLIQAHRLEMGTSLPTPAGKSLYAFWGERITQQLNADLDETGAKYLLNLASDEYFKSVKPKLLTKPLVACSFEDEKNGQFKTISFFAKRARGLMARFVVEQKIKKPQDLLAFTAQGYAFVNQSQDAKTGALHLHFQRSEQAREHAATAAA